MVAAHAFQHETGEGTVHSLTLTANTSTCMRKVSLEGLEPSNNPALLLCGMRALAEKCAANSGQLEHYRERK